MFKRLVQFLCSFTILFVVMLFLNSNLHSDTLLVSAIVALIVALLFVKTFAPMPYSLKSLYYAVIYLFVLTYEIIKANLQVVKIVLSPRININSKIVPNKTKLKSKTARLVLANSITLTPGTLTVDVDGDTFYIHYMNYHEGDDAVKVFEKYLEKIYA